jgi:hypothetical protein
MSVHGKEKKGNLWLYYTSELSSSKSSSLFFLSVSQNIKIRHIFYHFERVYNIYQNFFVLKSHHNFVFVRNLTFDLR